MQNNVVTLCLALFLRLLRNCFRQVAGMFVLQPARPGTFRPGVLSLSVDLDSARLDAVSRSLLWGSGIPVPEPARSAGCPPLPVLRPLGWHGAGPEIFLRRDV
jgi:hypothetical protein